LKQPPPCTPSKDDEELDDEEEALVQGSEELADELLPDCGMDPDEVEILNVPYSTRGPDDWVSSGTLDPEYSGERKLRYFPSWGDAERWAREFFGDRFKGRVLDAVNSGAPIWAFIIKGPRGVHAGR